MKKILKFMLAIVTFIISCAKEDLDEESTQEICPIVTISSLSADYIKLQQGQSSNALLLHGEDTDKSQFNVGLWVYDQPITLILDQHNQQRSTHTSEYSYFEVQHPDADRLNLVNEDGNSSMIYIRIRSTIKTSESGEVEHLNLIYEASMSKDFSGGTLVTGQIKATQRVWHQKGDRIHHLGDNNFLLHRKWAPSCIIPMHEVWVEFSLSVDC